LTIVYAIIVYAYIIGLQVYCVLNFFAVCFCILIMTSSSTSPFVSTDGSSSSIHPQEAASEDLLRAWMDNERVFRARIQESIGAPQLTREAILKLTGLELLCEMQAGRFLFTGIGKTLDFYLAEVSDGFASFQGTPGPTHFNPLGGIHGGWYATLLDSALGCSIHTKIPAGRGYTTAELSVNLVRAISPKVKRLRAEGRVIHCGRQIATAEARLVGPDGVLYAHGTTTCLVFDMPKG
jgi:uncharacterized protein (TIGR00369 family)